jgi:AsmA protein
MKRLLKILAVVILVLVVGLAALPFLLNANQFRPLLETKLSAVLSRQVKLGDLSLSLLAGNVSASDISIGDDPEFGSAPFLAAKSLAASVEMKPLIFDRKLNVTAVTIDRPEVNVVMKPNGSWNFSTLGGKSAGAPAGEPSPAASSTTASDLKVELVRITNGRFTLTRAGDPKTQVVEDIDIDLKNLSLTAPFTFTFSAKRAAGGGIKVEGTAGPLDANASHPPVQAKFTVPALDIAKAGLVDTSTGISGLAALSGDAQWKEEQANLDGHLSVERLKLAKGGTPATRAVSLDFAVAHDITHRRGQLRRADIHIGKAESRLSGSYDLAGKEPSLAVKFAGDKMALGELLAMLPALDIKLPAGSSLEGGTLSVDFTASGTPSHFTAAGPVSVDRTRLKNFDLGTKMKALETLAGIKSSPDTEIETLHADVKRSDEGTTLDKIQLTVPAIGEISGEGAISPKDDLAFNLQVLVHTSGAVMTALGQKGDTKAPFTLTGTVANPVIKANMKAIAAQEVQKLTKDPAKTVEAAEGILNLFRKKTDSKQPAETKQ